MIEQRANSRAMDGRQVLFDAVDTARKMLAEKIGPIEGARRIAHLYRAAGGGDDPIFTPFLVIDSESDTLVVGEDRSLWSQAFLEDVDRRYATYDASLRPKIAGDCEALLVALDKKLRECPACGFSPLAEMPYDAAAEPSYEECLCCDFQPGVTDEVGYDVEEWRRRWIAKGMPFCHPLSPSEWDATEHLNKAAFHVG